MSTFQHLPDSSNVQTNVVIVFRQLVNHWEEYFTVNWFSLLYSKFSM